MSDTFKKSVELQKRVNAKFPMLPPTLQIAVKEFVAQAQQANSKRILDRVEENVLEPFNVIGNWGAERRAALAQIRNEELNSKSNPTEGDK